MVDNIFVPHSGAEMQAQPETGSSPLGAFNIVIVAGAGLAANTAALLAFDRAAQSWAARISDPITVTINADLGSLGPGIIGSASSSLLVGAYDEVRNQLVADSANDANDGIVAHLPTLAQFSATLPGGRALSGDILISKANAKAAGFDGLDQAFGASDGNITFSNTFAFDFDHRDGVGPGLLDFETVAAHEIGHILGFSSIVDSIDFGQTSVDPLPLDLFRFAKGTAADPTTAAQFTTFPRDLTPGDAANTDEIDGPERAMSTGVNSGDGRQASHWKSDELTGEFIGLMDPTLANGQFYGPQIADFRALDLIGYDIAEVPEPSTASLGLVAVLIGIALSRRRLARR